jgi:hypothetical protein
MPERLAVCFALLLVLGFGLKLDRALSQPLAPQAAATASLARGLVEAGWSPLGENALLADGSFTAQRFQRGACHLEMALLPPGDQYLAVLREAWGSQARYLGDAGFSATAPQAGRSAQLARHLAHALGIGPRPALFGVAATSSGPCPLRLWEELSRLRPA